MALHISRMASSSNIVSLLPTQQAHHRLNPLTRGWVKMFEQNIEDRPHIGSSVLETEDLVQARHLQAHGANLLTSYADLELRRDERIVYETSCWVALVPFWAAQSFEVLILPRRQVARTDLLDEQERTELQDVLVWMESRYEDLLGIPFPDCIDWHQAPKTAAHTAHWQLHAHVCPKTPVLEWMATPEQAAVRIRETDENIRLRVTGA